MPPECKHNRFKVIKHKENSDCCLHCLDCDATWSAPQRAMRFLKSKVRGGQIIKIEKP